MYMVFDILTGPDILMGPLSAWEITCVDNVLNLRCQTTYKEY